MTTDYIIVGGGFAGLFLAHQLIKNGKNFQLFSDGKTGASQVSAGIVNPVVLKKFTTFWKAQEQIVHLQKTMLEIAEYAGENFLVNEQVHRIFHDEKEKEIWQKKRAQPDLQNFLSSEFVDFQIVSNPFATGKVLQSARLNVKGFFQGMQEFLRRNNFLIEETFDFKKLNPENSTYGNLKFSKIIFAEGIAARQNRFFKNLPIVPNKGHHLLVKFPEPLNLSATLKKKHFLFPMDENLFYYGGTYDRENLGNSIDETAISQLKKGLSEIYDGSFEIIGKNFGFRATVKDRRPILGRHPVYRNLFIFNGLGARGILNASYFSQHLFDLAENGTALPQEIDLRRFT